MSVITELFENYDHIPLEFRRQLLMMRELDERSNSKEVLEVLIGFRTYRGKGENQKGTPKKASRWIGRRGGATNQFISNIQDIIPILFICHLFVNQDDYQYLLYQISVLLIVKFYKLKPLLPCKLHFYDEFYRGVWTSNYQFCLWLLW